ncbi:MAG: flagellar export protein FliJ [Planctomycetota bacterium]
MPKFKFRLATLLRLRETDRDERRGQLGQAYRADEIIRRRLGDLTRELGDLATQNRQAAAPAFRKVLDVDRLLEVRRYELVVLSQRHQVDQQRQAIEVEIERRREALVDADRQVRVLEKLRQKQLERHRHEENRREIKQLDETAARHARQEDDE